MVQCWREVFIGTVPCTAPKHLADKILKDRSALEGERRQVSVLFADVAGFTSWAIAVQSFGYSLSIPRRRRRSAAFRSERS